MKKLWKILLTLFGGIVIVSALLVWWIYQRLVAPQNELEDQLRQILRTHDKNVIEKLSVDDATAQFLLKTPSDAPISTADFQGGGPSRSGALLGLFPATIGTQHLDCCMASNDAQSFFSIPHWKLIKISLKPIGIDPNWTG
jgi:hypothetical protein